MYSVGDSLLIDVHGVDAVYILLNVQLLFSYFFSMSQSQTRRKGTEILRDEINSIIGVVRSHSENLTRRLERVRDLTVKYCAEKGRTASASASAAPPAAAASAAESSAPLPMAPPRTILPRALNTIPEVNEGELSPASNVEPGSPSVPLASQMNVQPAAAVAQPVASQSVPRSKGPVPWTMFRSKLAEGTNLKTGKSNTMKQVSALWEKAKAGNSVGEIEKYLRNQLRIEPAVAAQKAPELEKIARNAVGRVTSKVKAPTARSKRVTRSEGPGGGALTVENVATSAPAPASAPAPKSRKSSKVGPQPINPNNETDEGFWERMNAAAVADAEKKTQNAMRIPQQREASRAAAAALAATPLKNRQVQIPTLIPNSNAFASRTMTGNNGKTMIFNPSTGKYEPDNLSL